MTRFSEYLEQVIMRSGMKEKDLAKASGFARSYIALMKTGQRVSPDIDKMSKLMYALNLPPYEMEEFKEEYYRARIGDEAYERDESVMDFIHSFNNTSKLYTKEHHVYEIPDVKTVNNRMDLEWLIKAIIKNEAEKKNGFVHIMMQGTGNLLKNILPDVCDSNKELEIEHIVCMEQSGDQKTKSENLYNIRMLRELIPITVFSNSQNYKLYYYYDHVASKYNTGSLFSYMVLTSEYLICMDANITMGMLCKDEAVRELYECVFQKNKRNCREMIHYISNESEMIRYQEEIKEQENITYSIAQQPCFGVLKIQGLFRKYANHMNKQLFSNLQKMVQKNSEIVDEDNHKHISYCTKEGLRRFAIDGVIDELPKEICGILEKRDRKYILMLLLEMIEAGKYEIYLLDEKEDGIPKELFINVYSVTEMMVLYLSENLKTRFAVNESSITKIIYESLKNMLKNPRIGTLEASKIYIRKLIQEIEKMP